VLEKGYFSLYRKIFSKIESKSVEPNHGTLVSIAEKNVAYPFALGAGICLIDQKGKT
jgi:hypothetical protein